MGNQAFGNMHLTHQDSSAVIAWSTKCISGFNSTEFDNSISQFAQQHEAGYTAAAVIALVLGALMLFFGYSLFYFTLGVAGFLLGAGASFFLLCGATDTLLVAGIGGAILGISLGYLVVKLEKLGVLTVGLVGGLIAALYTNGFVMTHLYSQFSSTSQSWMPYAYASVLACIGAYLALKLEKLILIAVTSFGGAYLLGFGIIRLGWKSSEADLGPLYLFSGNGCEGTFCKVALILIILVALVGMFMQFRRTSEHSNRFSKCAHQCQDVVQIDGQDSTVLLIRGQQVKGLQL